MVAKYEMPGREKIEDQSDRRGDRQWNYWPAGQSRETVNEPQEDAQVEKGTDTVDDGVSAPLVDNACVLSVEERVLPIEVPRHRHSGSERAKTRMQEAKFENAVQYRENSSVYKEADRAYDDEAASLLNNDVRH